jgi:hypothetical protein
MSSSDGGDTWYPYKDPYGGYFIFGPGSTDNKVYIWVIWTWKSGKTKNAYAENWGEAKRVEAMIPAAKTTKYSWIVDFVDANSRTVLMGDMKAQKVGSTKTASCLTCHTSLELASLGDITPNIPAKLSGSSVMDDNEGPTWWDLWTETLALTFNAKETLNGHTGGDFTAAAVKEMILYELDNAGYSTSSD